MIHRYNTRFPINHTSKFSGLTKATMINNNIANGVCLKSYDGTCKKRESNAGYAFLICNQGNVMDKICVLNIALFTKS